MGDNSEILREATYFFMNGMALQNIYIAILNPIYNNFIRKMDIDTRELYVKIIFHALQCYFILFFSGSFSGAILFTYNQRELLGGILILLATIFSIKEPLRYVKWRGTIVASIVLSAVGMITTGLIHPIGSGYLAFGVILLFIYPCFYFVWNNRQDYEKLFDIIATSNVNVGTVYFIYCIIVFWEKIFQIDGGRFSGSVPYNPNLFGLIGMALTCSAAYMMYRKISEGKNITYYVIAAVMGAVIATLGQSRSSILVEIIAIALATAFTIKKMQLKFNIRKLIILGCMAIMIIAMIMLPAKAEGEKTERENISNKGILERFSYEGKDINSFTSGRINLWRNYVEKINFIGNNFDQTNWKELTGERVSHAHNNFLEYGYRCGIIVASAFFVMEIFALIIALYYILAKRRKKDCYLYAGIFFAAYFVMSMIDIATLPMERYASFGFYQILALLIDRRG